MRILQITNGFPPTATAGVEQYTHQLSRGLSAHHDVRIFCRESAPERADYTILDEELDGLRVRRVVNDFQHAAQIQDFYLDRRIESIFQQTLREWQPDLLHFQHCIGLSASLLEAAGRAEVPYLLTLHDYWFICSRVQLLHRQGHICPGPIADVDCYDCTFSPDDIFRRLKGTWLYRVLRSRLNDYTKRRILGALARATPNLPLARRGPTLSPYKERDRYMLSVLSNTPLLLTPSRFVRDLYIRHGVPESQVQVLPLGLDLSPWRVTGPEEANAANGLRVGYLGSLLRHKGVDLLVRAFRQLQTPGSTLQIYGFAMPGDPYINQLRRLVSQDPRVQLMDRYDQKDLPGILSKLDVIVIPSLWHETFSIVAREALLSGTPVVASETGALPEVINSGQNGLLVPVGDAEALHDALDRLSVDPDLLARMKHGARLSAQKIKSMDEHVHEVDLLYKTLASQRQGSVTTGTTSPVTASPKPGRADHLEAHP
jgi:glycosyltransferase involved in cell wall biosynthesis